MVQILGCGRTIGGGRVAFDITWEGALPADAPVLWSMEISNGEESVLLGHQRSGGAVTQFVDATSTDEREEVADDADVGDGEIVARFPEDVVGVAVEWPVWTAIIAVDGAEVASQVCTASS